MNFILINTAIVARSIQPQPVNIETNFWFWVSLVELFIILFLIFLLIRNAGLLEEMINNKLEHNQINTNSNFKSTTDS